MDDPNSDLLGFSFDCEDGATATVDKTVAWSDEYVRVTLRYPDNRTIPDIVKPAAVVRRRKELDNA